jgi:hypothetical protein
MGLGSGIRDPRTVILKKLITDVVAKKAPNPAHCLDWSITGVSKQTNKFLADHT